MNSNLDKSERMKRALEALRSIPTGKKFSGEALPELDASYSEQYAKARSLALRKIGIARSTSSGKVIRHLRENDLPREVIDKVIEDLSFEGYLDDERCCRRIIARHQGSRAKSKAMMKMLFIQQGIEESIAQSVSESLEDDYSNLSKLREKEGKMDKEEEIKWARKMLGRGFPNHIVMQVLREEIE